MPTSLSSRNPLSLALKAHYLSVDPGVFLGEGGFNSKRPPVSVDHHGDVRPAQIELARNAALYVAGKFRSIGASIHNGVVDAVNLEDSLKVKDAYISVKQNVGTLSRGEQLALIGSKIKDLRVRLQMNQKPIAALCGVSRVQISRWEHALDQPPAAALLKLSELAPAQERQWWRDQAARQVGFDLDASGAPDLAGIFPKYMRTIPLLKEAKGMSELALAPNQIEREIHFPTEWFPEGGAIRAVRIRGVAISEMIAIVDISRRDADRLVGHLVAVETSTGVEVRWLRLVDGDHMLMPFYQEQQIRKLRSDGENSIVGLVRWIGDSAEPPGKPGQSN